jgi:hypothetical protein
VAFINAYKQRLFMTTYDIHKNNILEISDPHDIPLHTHRLRLYHHQGNQYVTLNCLAELTQRYSPQTDERMLRIKLQDMAEKLPQGALITMKTPQDVALLVLTLPTAIKLLNHSSSPAYRKLHDLLLDVLVEHLPAITAAKQAKE